MKVRIEIAGPLFRKVRRLAARRGTTLSQLVEEGLRRRVSWRRKKRPFRLRDASFKGGKGLSPEFADADWEKIRDVIYEGRGGRPAETQV